MSKSYHIFYFPFIVKHGGAENAIVKALNSSNFGKLWKRAPQVYKTEEYYDEKMYYHHFVHNALYDNGKNLGTYIQLYTRIFRGFSFNPLKFQVSHY